MIVKHIKESAPYRRLVGFYERYENLLIPATLIFGLVIDFITFRQIQIETFLQLLGVYLVVAGGLIAFVHIHDSRWQDSELSFLQYGRIAAPLLLQFAFGALLSASFLFYWFGGTVFVSWPFILMIVFLLTTNDILREYYMKPVAQVTVYFFVLFTISTIALPYVLRSIDPRVFAISGAVSLGVIGVYLFGLFRLAPKLREQRQGIAVGILSVFILINGLYVSNILPPIPLSLRDSGVYHDIQRVNGVYELLAENQTWSERLTPGQTIHIKEGDPVYVFTAIFAPADLDTTIYHHWQSYDDQVNEWEDQDRLPFFVTGGREAGYRGYSLKRAVFPGLWRVDVETETGQVLGRIYFRIERTNQSVETIRVTR